MRASRCSLPTVAAVSGAVPAIPDLAAPFPAHLRQDAEISDQPPEAIRGRNPTSTHSTKGRSEKSVRTVGPPSGARAQQPAPPDGADQHESECLYHHKTRPA